MPLAVGQVLHNNRYRIVEVLPSGGMGNIYKAWDSTLDIHVAIKENSFTTPEAQKQFIVEAKLLAKLRHQNLPKVTDYFTIQNQGQYIVMEFVEGKDVQQIIDDQSVIPETQALTWISQVCDGLIYMHSREKPIIHRDIKPKNIRILPDGTAILVDFGIAKEFDPNRSTSSGARAISPGYSPPEMYGSGKSDERSDIYALGATLYHMLTGRRMPDSVDLLSGNAGTLMMPRQINPAISQNVEEVINRCIELNKNQRYQSVKEVQVRLLQQSQAEDAVVVPLPSKPGTFKWVVAGIGGIMVIVILAMMIANWDGVVGFISRGDSATEVVRTTEEGEGVISSETPGPTDTRIATIIEKASPSKTPPQTKTPTSTRTRTPTSTKIPSPSATYTITSTPLPEGYSIVPDVVGMNYEDAQTVLRESGFENINLRYSDSDTGIGNVLNQSLQPNEIRNKRDRIYIDVAAKRLRIYLRGYRNSKETITFHPGYLYEIYIGYREKREDPFKTEYHLIEPDNEMSCSFYDGGKSLSRSNLSCNYGCINMDWCFINIYRISLRDEN